MFYVPYPYSFPNENVLCRRHSLWHMSDSATVSTESIVGYLRGRLGSGGVDVFSLESVIDALKEEKPGNYYLPRNGHWTPLAHLGIGDWLAETFFAGHMIKQ